MGFQALAEAFITMGITVEQLDWFVMLLDLSLLHLLILLLICFF